MKFTEKERTTIYIALSHAVDFYIEGYQSAVDMEDISSADYYYNQIIETKRLQEKVIQNEF